MSAYMLAQGVEELRTDFYGLGEKIIISACLAGHKSVTGRDTLDVLLWIGNYHRETHLCIHPCEYVTALRGVIYSVPIITKVFILKGRK